MHRLASYLVTTVFLAAIAATAGAQAPQALHLFSGDNPFVPVSASGEILRDESDRLFASHSLSFTTEGDGANVHAALTDLAPIDLRERTVVIWVKVDSVANLNDLWIYFGNDSSFADRIVYMISRDRTQLVDNTWLRVTLPRSEQQSWGNPDLSRMTAIQLWVNDRGTAPVTVRFDGLGLIPARAPGSVVLTFDDGWIDTIAEAAPAMAERDMAGTAFVIPELVGSDGYMSLAEIGRLRDQFGWSIGAHALGPLTTEQGADREARLDRLVSWFESNGFGERGLDLAYPNGAFDASLLEMVRPRFRSARTIVEFGESLPPGDPHRIRIFNVLRQTTPDQLEAVVSRAQNRGELVVLVFHRVTSEAAAETVVAPDRFAQMLDVIAAANLPVVTLDELFASLGDLPAEPAQPASVEWDELLRIDIAPAQEGPTAGARPEAPSETDARVQGSTQDPPGPVRLEQSDRVAIGDGTFTFGFDWKFLLGRDATGSPTYFTQLDELFLTLTRPVGEFGRLVAVGGIRPVVFDDLSTGAISGDDLYLDSIVFSDDLSSRFFAASPVQLSVEAGYRDYAPRNKWAGVTQWFAIESPFGQDLTPASLWLGFHASSGGAFASVAASPDFVGVAGSNGRREITTNRSSSSTVGAGVPQLFANAGGEIESSLGSTLLESAVSVGGDSVKWVALGRHRFGAGQWDLGASLGWKALWGTQFETYPLWETHENGRYTISAGLAPAWTSGSGVLVSLGVSYGVTRNFYTAATNPAMLGIDLRVGRGVWELFAGTATFNVTNWNYAPSSARTAGWEAGLAVNSGEVTYMIGYTTAGFAMRSGLYGNRFDAGGGDGLFIRILP